MNADYWLQAAGWAVVMALAGLALRPLVNRLGKDD